MADVFLDACTDTARLIPPLFFAYLLMEFLERRMSGKTICAVKKAGRFGPLVGGALGLVPQCGFSAAASGLFSGGVITAGTLVAVFLATSDEMLPIMISSGAPAALILKILAVKFTIGAAVGFALDAVLKKAPEPDVSGICGREHCHCEKGNIFLSALKHTLNVSIFIFAATLALNIAVYLIGKNNLSSIIMSEPLADAVMASAVGLIPNCASSVLITEFYIDGLISSGALIAGLLSGSGTGMLVLFRANKNIRQNLLILLFIFFAGALAGIAFDLLKIVL